MCGSFGSVSLDRGITSGIRAMLTIEHRPSYIKRS
jgi:hypothetical protein